MLGFGESMSGGNLTTPRDPRSNGSPGSESEQTSRTSPWTPDGGNHVPDPAAGGHYDTSNNKES